ncbi:hypothetical protein M9Y10_035745 [Tritrichomonas musculus]|uniref:EF-hand domain-containing protein n=1 Tax=Tritrichomonas musculus TaxID=1915356 RepID=A0ABR2GY99_9EUKA
MSIEKCLGNMKSVYEGLLNFIDDDRNEAINFENLNKIFQDIKIRDDKFDLKLFFHLIVSICNNHHSCPNFFDKIDRIVNYFKDDIKKYYSNPEIFDIFKSNKRLLLFLIEEKIMNMDEQVVKQIITR